MTSTILLATKCPQTDGNVVFAAQNLYNDITNEHRLFVTNCDADNSQNIAYRGIKPVEKVQEKLGKLDNRIEVYPNPSTNIITVKGDGFKRIELINAYGAIIYSNGNISGNTITINLNKYSSGLYYLRITETNNATTTRKIIKNLN